MDQLLKIKHRKLRYGAALAMAGLLSSGHALAEIDLGGGIWVAGGGSLEMPCSNLNLNGFVELGAGGSLAGAALTVTAGSTLDATDGSVQLGGDLQVAGDMKLERSAIEFTNNCASQPRSESRVSGVSQFHSLAITAAPVAQSTSKAKTLPADYGHSVYLPAGQTVSVSNSLTMRDASLLSTGAAPALLSLQASATQNITNVGVSNVNGVPAGQWLAENQTNQLANATAERWFAKASPPTPGTGGSPHPVPGLDGAAIAMLST